MAPCVMPVGGEAKGVALERGISRNQPGLLVAERFQPELLRRAVLERRRPTALLSPSDVHLHERDERRSLETLGIQSGQLVVMLHGAHRARIIREERVVSGQLGKSAPPEKGGRRILHSGAAARRRTFRRTGRRVDCRPGRRGR